MGFKLDVLSIKVCIYITTIYRVRSWILKPFIHYSYYSVMELLTQAGGSYLVTGYCDNK